MSTCKLIIKDEVNIQINGLPVEVRRKIVSKLRYFLPYARHATAYKLGRWDGTKTYFSIGGTGYLAHLDIILPIIEQSGYQVEVEDRRKPIDLKFDSITESYWADQGKVWPTGHRFAGEPIMLRDDQANAINIFLQNPQSLQSISTGAGKCLTGNTLLTLKVDPRTKFGSYLKDNWFDVTIGELAEYIEKFMDMDLLDCREVDIHKLGISVPTPVGYMRINSFIKKYNLPCIAIYTNNGYSFTCARQHILLQDGNDVYAEELKVGDFIDHESGKLKVIHIKTIHSEDCYDVGIGAPHVYYDANGVLHHNTITTATLSKLCEPYGRSMIIVPSKDLVQQTEADYKNVGLDVGVYFGPRKELGKTHTICTWQSLNALQRKDPDAESLTLAEFIDKVTAVIVDECHQVTGEVLSTLLTQNFNQCPIRWGLTGTVPKEPYEFQGILASLGPVVNTVTAKDLQDKEILAKLHINILKTMEIESFANFAAEYDFLVTNKKRLEWLAEKVIEMTEAGNTLILINRIETGKELQKLIPNCSFVNGKVALKKRKSEYDEIATSDDKVIIATYGVASTGINLPRIFNLVLFEPGKSFTRVIQSIGRGIRKAEDKDYVDVYDITSACKYSARHLTERKRYYKEAKYPFTISKVIL